MYIRRAFLVCDRCGKTHETEASGDPFTLAGNDDSPRAEGWISTGRDHHLCPECAKAYLEKKDEMERELKRLAGIRTIEMDF